MRTTLKRELHRAGADRTGGHRRPPPPPIAPSFYRAEGSQRSLWRLVARVLFVALAALVSLAAAVAGGAYLYAHDALTSISAHSVGVKRSEKLLTHKVPAPTHPAIALLIGYDRRAGVDASLGDVGSRSDTIMLLRTDPAAHAISMLSFPRDLRVPIRCPRQPVVVDRINAAWSRCGAVGTLRTVEALTGVKPNYLVTVDFHGFKLLVNKLHGVYLDVDHRYLNTQGGPGGYATIDLEPGYQKLDGGQALDFVRFRHTDSDLYRLARQQEFVSALRTRISQGLSLTEVLHVVGALRGNLEIAEGGGGSVSPQTALHYVNFLRQIPSSSFIRTTIQGISGYDELTAPPSAIASAVSQFEHPDVGARRRTSGRKPRRRVPSTAPSASPASALVVAQPWLTESTLATLRPRLPFPILVPQRVATLSTAAALDPFRVYAPVPGRRALRITFSRGLGYWGIEETNWSDAPILAHPSQTRRIGGRTFQLYRNGAHLHMVVLRTPRATYWVVNTLLDDLSNATMLSIATGLRSLPAA